MAEPSKGSRTGAVAFIVVAAVVAVVFIGLTISDKVVRGEPWWPWLLLPLATGAAAGAAVLIAQRLGGTEGGRPAMRWALVVATAGMALIGLSVFLVANGS